MGLEKILDLLQDQFYCPAMTKGGELHIASLIDLSDLRLDHKKQWLRKSRQPIHYNWCIWNIL